MLLDTVRSRAPFAHSRARGVHLVSMHLSWIKIHLRCFDVLTRFTAAFYDSFVIGAHTSCAPVRRCLAFGFYTHTHTYSNCTHSTTTAKEMKLIKQYKSSEISTVIFYEANYLRDNWFDVCLCATDRRVRLHWLTEWRAGWLNEMSGAFFGFKVILMNGTELRAYFHTGKNKNYAPENKSKTSSPNRAEVNR